ncbi:MAG TPA: hypothetical protein VNB88_11765 [Gaiellaceae bacterium]|nr:hypothetical protein [Gaiellaceae bacterium]
MFLFAWLGLKVHSTVDQLAVLGTGVEDAGTEIQGGFETAAEAVAGVPIVGDDLADGLRDAGRVSGGELAERGQEGRESVHRLANLLGLVTFLIPALLVLSLTLPERISQIRGLTAAERVLGGPLDPDRRRLLAMRAAFSLPYGELVRYTRDPFGDLAAGRYDALIAAALEEAGLRLRSD